MKKDRVNRLWNMGKEYFSGFGLVRGGYNGI